MGSPGRISGSPPPAARIGALGLFFRLLWTAFVVLTPLAGVWLGSSLAAYLGGPRWLVLAAGLLLFPGLPVGWELWSLRRGPPAAKRRMSTWGRLVARTLAVNLLFLGLLVGLNPQSSFAALSTRGDWMLDGRSDARSLWIRGQLFAAAGGLEWLYRATREDPYARWEEQNPRPVPPPPLVSDVPAMPVTRTPLAPSEPDAGVDPGAIAIVQPRAASPSWPLEAALHPAVVSMPSEAETSLAAVAQHLARAEPDPLLRIKALHDYVADRIEYDVQALASGNFGEQDAQTVFRTRKGVCAGYAQLLTALGREVGVEIAFIGGQARLSTTGALSPHAWNAAQLGGRWLLIDATWNAGTVDDGKFKKRFRTDYLFTSPEVFVLDHLPDEPGWQRLVAPVSVGDFLRQPALHPAFFIEGLTLVSPNRSRIDAAGTVVVEIRNPRGVTLLGTAKAVGGAAPPERCTVEEAALTRVSCRLPADGPYRVELFGGPVLSVNATATGVNRSYGMLGSIEVNNRT